MTDETGPAQQLLNNVRDNVQGMMKDVQARRVSMMAKRSDSSGTLMDKVKSFRGDRKILGADGYQLGKGKIFGEEGFKLGQGKILGEEGLKFGNGELLKKIPRPLGLIKFGQDEGNGTTGNGDSGGNSGTGTDVVDDTGSEFEQMESGETFEFTPKVVRGH